MRRTQLSFSKLNTYEQCPLKYDLQYNQKAFPDDSNNPNFVRGNEIHGQLESYVIWKIQIQDDRFKDTPPPAMRQEAKNGIPIVDKLFDTFETILPEQKVAVNENWEKTPWLARDVRWRAVFDLIALRKSSSEISGNFELIVSSKLLYDSGVSEEVR